MGARASFEIGTCRTTCASSVAQRVAILAPVTSTLVRAAPLAALRYAHHLACAIARPVNGGITPTARVARVGAAPLDPRADALIRVGYTARTGVKIVTPAARFVRR